MDVPREYQTKWNKPGRENHISFDTIFMLYLKKVTNKFIHKMEIDAQI